MQVEWFVQKMMIEYLGLERLCDEIVAQGHNLNLLDYDPIFQRFNLYPTRERDKGVVIYGTIEFTRKFVNEFPDMANGAFGNTSKLETTKIFGFFDPEYLLNGDGVFITWKHYKQRKNQMFDIFGDKIFIRPASPNKTFTGTTLTRDNVDFEINSMEQVTSVVDETLILVASAKEIINEFRFVIVNNEIASYSGYSWDNKPVECPSEACISFVKEILSKGYEVDLAYTLDVAATPTGFKVVEFNSFSSAGLYNCDVKPIVEKVSALAHGLRF